jgi:hypothetical protein
MNDEMATYRSSKVTKRKSLKNSDSETSEEEEEEDDNGEIEKKTTRERGVSAQRTRKDPMNKRQKTNRKQTPMEREVHRGRERANLDRRDDASAYITYSEGCGTMSSLTEEKILLDGCVRDLFAKKKFFTNESELESNGKVAKFIYKQMRIGGDAGEREAFWKDHRKDVKKLLDQRRSAVTNAIKMEFMSELSASMDQDICKSQTNALQILYFRRSAGGK